MSAPLRAGCEGGRAAARVLLRGLSLLCLLAGLLIAAQGAWIPAKAMVAQVLLERAFAASRAGGEPVKPWPWADTMPVAQISVGRLGVSDVVLSGGSGQAMAFGPTLLAGPGASGNRVTVLAAHRDTHFAWMKDLRAGDVITFERIGQPAQHFRVRSFATVRWNRFAVPRDPPQPLLALTTCYPFEAVERGPWRRVAWAEPVEPAVSRANGAR